MRLAACMKKFAPGPLWLALCLAVVTNSCCSAISLPLSRISGFLSGVFTFCAQIDISTAEASTFSGDFASYADIPAFYPAKLEVDLTGAVYVEGSGSQDIDEDAHEETLGFVATDAPDTLAFVTWRGDKYTVDKGICYLGWAIDNSSHLAAAYCGDDAGVMYCTQVEDDDASTTCEKCDATGQCSDCKMSGDLVDCVPKSSSSASVDIDIDIDIDVDVGDLDDVLDN